MLETYTFTQMLPTMQPPQQWVPEDPSPEKVITIFKLRIYLTPPVVMGHLGPAQGQCPGAQNGGCVCEFCAPPKKRAQGQLHIFYFFS
jgi:hypothetical protein